MVYHPLKSERYEIRLLTIRMDGSPTITCTLNTVSLLDEPLFKALSYHWGREKAPQLLLLDGAETEITANLDQALRQFRQENHGPIFVDALCINQNDNVEKSEQVLLMKEIYSKATEVIAWLGPAEGQSDGAMELMNTFGKSCPRSEMTPGLAGGDISSADCLANEVVLWDAVDKVLGSSYWQRTWILQELSLAKTVVFRCGTQRAAFDDLHALFSVICRRIASLNSNVQELTLRAAHLDSIALILSLRDLDGMNKDGIPLTSILVESGGQLVSDLRDKVYGMLGMASDVSILVPRPSYDISAGEVYVHLTRSLIVNRKSLAYIRFKSPFGTCSLEIPSWAMDLSTPCFDASSIVSQDILHFPLDWEAGAEVNAVFSDSEYGKDTALWAWGMVMGTVDAIGSVLPTHSSFSNSQYEVIEPACSTNRYGSETATLEAIVEALLGSRQAPNKDFKESLEQSFRLECHKFSIKTLMKPENRGLLALIPELSEWLDKNRDFIFAGRSLESWFTVAANSVPVWKGGWLRGKLMRPRAGSPHKRTPDDHALALRQVPTEDLGMTQTEEDTDNLVKNLPSLELGEAEDEGHAEIIRQVPRHELEGDGIDRIPRESAVPAETSSGLGFSLSSLKVFNRLVRVRRNATAALNARYPVSAALHNAPKSSSLTENELEKIELTVKALLAKLVRYRRIITTSSGNIGMAHPQVRKNDTICSFRDREQLLILREEPLLPDEPPRMATWTTEHSSGEADPNNKTHAFRKYRVIGEVDLAGLHNPEFLPDSLEWELCVLI